MLVAAGTSPNITYEKEAPDTFQLDAKKKFFQPHRVRAEWRRPLPSSRRMPTGSSRPTTRTAGSSRYYGDNHPRYAGNVVKAMASAKDGYPQGASSSSRDELARLDPARQAAARRRLASPDRDAGRRVHRARRGRRPPDADDRRSDRQGAGGGAGTSIRVSSIGCRTSSRSRRACADGATMPLLMEGIALTGAWVDKERVCCR